MFLQLSMFLQPEMRSPSSWCYAEERRILQLLSWTFICIALYCFMLRKSNNDLINADAYRHRMQENRMGLLIFHSAREDVRNVSFLKRVIVKNDHRPDKN